MEHRAMDDRQVSLSDLASIQTDIRELRGQLTAVVDSLGHIRVEVAKGLAKGEGDTRVLDTKAVMIYMIITMIGSALMPLLISRMFPTVVATPVVVQPAMSPIPVPPPVQR